MPKPIPLTERSLDLQVAIREARVRHGAPVWTAVMASGDFESMGLAHDVDHLLRLAERKARALTGRLDARECADGMVGINHGRAA